MRRPPAVSSGAKKKNVFFFEFFFDFPKRGLPWKALKLQGIFVALKNRFLSRLSKNETAVENIGKSKVNIENFENSGFSVDVRVSTSDTAAAVRGKLLEALPRLKGPALSLSLRGEALEEGAALSACGVQDGDAVKVSSRAWRKPRAATVTVALGARELTVPIDASTTVRGLQRAVKAQPASCSQTFIQETQ